MEYHCQPLWKNWKLSAISLILIVWKNFKLLTPQSLGLWFFWVSTEMEYHREPTNMKKLKNGCHFINIDRMEKCQLLTLHMIKINEMAAILQCFHNGQPLQSLGLWFSECRKKWNITVGHYEKIEKWLPFHYYWWYGKISNYRPPKFGSLVFQVSTVMEYHCWPLWKNWKMAAILLILIIWKIFKLLIPPKFGSLVFRVSTETKHHHRPLWKNWKMATISLILIVWKNSKLLTPQSLGLWFFWVSKEIEYHCRPLWKNWKMAAISLILIIWKNFKLPSPLKVWVSGFPNVNRNGISPSAIMKKLKNGCHFINIDDMEKFQITDPQSLGLWFFRCRQ